MILNRSKVRIVDCNDNIITFYYNGEVFKYNIKDNSVSTDFTEHKFFINQVVKDLIVEYFRCEVFKDITVYKEIVEIKTRYNTVYLFDLKTKKLYLRTDDNPACSNVPDFSFLYKSFKKRLGNLNNCCLSFMNNSKYDAFKDYIVIEFDL